MIDIHSHILPGLDDGADSMEEALAMAESAIADGITHVVATPHASNHYFFDYANVRQVLGTLQARLGDRLTLATGCDFHVSPENLVELRKDAARYCINQHDCLLVEFSEFSMPPAIDQTLHELQLAGLRPIVTHPERNGILRARPERLRGWVLHGCYAQVTAGALTGTFGRGAQRNAENWIEQGLIHFVASDAHNTRGRPLRLRPAYDVVAKRFGEEKARALFLENPRAAFEGRPLPHVPEVAETPPPPRKRFFFF
jgi:protein-tyrosine phosphatase